MKILAGLRLRAARLTLGVEAEKEMAEKLGVSGNAYSNYECGVRLVDVAMAVRLLELTGIGPDWIYAGSTTGVPFDRAQSLRSHLQRLGKSATSTQTPTPNGRAPPRPRPGGSADKSAGECDERVVRLPRVPA